MLKSVTAEGIFIPMKEPFKYALDVLTELPYVLIRIKDDSGLEGIGEAAAATDITGETQKSVIEIVEFAKHFMIGRNLETKKDIEAIMADICSHIVENNAAKSAIEMALFDLVGKKKNIPVWKILGGKKMAKLKIQKTYGFFDDGRLEDKVKESVEKAIKEGADVIKYKVGRNKKYDLSLVKFARKYAKKTKISLDANQGWKNFSNADAIFKELKEYKLSWIEQPVLAGDYDSSAKLQKKYGVPIMIDEGLKNLKDLELIKIKKAGSIVNIKIAKVGGFLNAKKIINFCDKNHIKYVLGDMIHSDIGMAANLHLATLGNFLSYDIDNTRVKDRIVKGIKNDGLFYEIPQGPGLGISF